MFLTGELLNLLSGLHALFGQVEIETPEPRRLDIGMVYGADDEETPKLVEKLAEKMLHSMIGSYDVGVSSRMVNGNLHMFASLERK